MPDLVAATNKRQNMLADFYFPAKVPGWLSEAEGRALAELAEGKTVLEMGTFKGRATLCLAQTASVVHTVDTHQHYSLPCLLNNLDNYPHKAKVIIHIGSFEDVVSCLTPCFDLVFIDGEHLESQVWTDSTLANSVLKPVGMLAWHDYGHPEFPGVKRCVNFIVKGSTRMDQFRVVDTLAMVRCRKESASTDTGTRT